MIRNEMANYEYYTYGDKNAYGQRKLSSSPIGNITMAIYTTSQSIQENILYKEASYIGLTNDTKVNDTYVIDYEGKKLKVLYVQPKGRYKQVFMGSMA